jgi:hypothetical protein
MKYLKGKAIFLLIPLIFFSIQESYSEEKQTLEITEEEVKKIQQLPMEKKKKMVENIGKKLGLNDREITLEDLMRAGNIKNEDGSIDEMGSMRYLFYLKGFIPPEENPDQKAKIKKED